MNLKNLAERLVNKPSKNGKVVKERNGHAPEAQRGGSQAEQQPWQEPIPLTEVDTTGPAYPVQLLPQPLQDWVLQGAENYQVPPDLLANLALAIAGFAISKKILVGPREGWREPTNIYTLTALPPGERKTIVFSTAEKPLAEIERQLVTDSAPIIAKAESVHRQMEARLRHLENKIAKEEDAETRASLKVQIGEAIETLQQHQVPVRPQLICDDVTSEALGKLLAEQGGKILLASAEGGAFENCKGRYSEGANFDVFLKGHAGDTLRLNRVSRGHEFVEDPALSCAMVVQPTVIQGLAEETTMKGKGFLARWLFPLPKSSLGSRQTRGKPITEATRHEYHRLIADLW